MSNSVLKWNVSHNSALYYKTTYKNLLDHLWQNKFRNFATLKRKKILLAENHWFLQTGFNCITLLFHLQIFTLRTMYTPASLLYKILEAQSSACLSSAATQGHNNTCHDALLPPKKHKIPWTFKSHWIHLHPDHLFLPPTKLRYKSILHSIHTYLVQQPLLPQ